MEFNYLAKQKHSRILDVDTITVCKSNKLLGINTIKGYEETGIDADDFVHVIQTIMKDYDEYTIVKIYDDRSISLKREMKAFEKLHSFRNSVRMICNFVCMDEKERWKTRITSPITFCNNKTDKLRFVVMEYIDGGDAGMYLSNNKSYEIVNDFFIQLTMIIANLMYDYKIMHGDLNTGNILLTSTKQKQIEYKINGDIYRVKSHGIIPILCDFGRCIHCRTIETEYMMDDIMIAIAACSNYIQDKQLKHKYIELVHKNYDKCDIGSFITKLRKI